MNKGAMDIKESKEGKWVDLEGEEEREKWCNYVIISKIKDSKECKRNLHKCGRIYKETWLKESDLWTAILRMSRGNVSRDPEQHIHISLQVHL